MCGVIERGVDRDVVRKRCMKPIPTLPAAVRDLTHEAAARGGGGGRPVAVGTALRRRCGVQCAEIDEHLLARRRHVRVLGHEGRCQPGEQGFTARREACRDGRRAQCQEIVVTQGAYALRLRSSAAKGARSA